MKIEVEDLEKVQNLWKVKTDNQPLSLVQFQLSEDLMTTNLRNLKLINLSMVKRESLSLFLSSNKAERSRREEIRCLTLIISTITGLFALFFVHPQQQSIGERWF
jgi:hypothetical protein